MQNFISRCENDGNAIRKGKKRKGKKVKEKDIQERAKIFYSQVAEYINTYSPAMLRSFYDYWTDQINQTLK